MVTTKRVLKGDSIKWRKQVTQGQNIVVDGWAGVYNPNPYLLTHSMFTHTNNHNCSTIKARFRTFQLVHQGLTDQRTNKPTNKASFRVACSLLKRNLTKKRTLLPFFSKCLTLIILNDTTPGETNTTRPDTRLPQSRSGWQEQ